MLMVTLSVKVLTKNPSTLLIAIWAVADTFASKVALICMTDLADTCATAAKRSWIDCERESSEAPPKGGNADDPVLGRLPSLPRPAAADLRRATSSAHRAVPAGSHQWTLGFETAQ